MGTDVATTDRRLAPAGTSDVDDDKSASMNFGDRLLVVFAGMVAVVCGGSALALLVMSITFFE
jgi:hypothetical protein